MGESEINKPEINKPEMNEPEMNESKVNEPKMNTPKRNETKENQGIEKEFLAVKDVVAMGLCSQAQAYCLFHSKDFPAIRVGAALRVRKDDFEKWVEQQKGGK